MFSLKHKKKRNINEQCAEWHVNYHSFSFVLCFIHLPSIKCYKIAEFKKHTIISQTKTVLINIAINATIINRNILLLQILLQQQQL